MFQGVLGALGCDGGKEVHVQQREGGGGETMSSSQSRREDLAEEKGVCG